MRSCAGLGSLEKSSIPIFPPWEISHLYYIIIHITSLEMSRVRKLFGNLSFMFVNLVSNVNLEKWRNSQCTCFPRNVREPCEDLHQAYIWNRSCHLTSHECVQSAEPKTCCLSPSKPVRWRKKTTRWSAETTLHKEQLSVLCFVLLGKPLACLFISESSELNPFK